MESKEVSDELKTKLEEAIKELQTALAGDDVDDITVKMTAMLDIAQELNQAKPTESSESTNVDAEFTEVK